MKQGIVAAGHWIIDHVKVIDHYPRQSSLATVLNESMGNGGGPYNVLKDLSRLRVDIPLRGIGLVGDDDLGRIILDDCRKSGIDPRGLSITGLTSTSYTDVMTVQSSGERTFFHNRGANARFTEDHVDDSVLQGRLFYLGYMALLDALDAIGADGMTGAARIFERARRAGLGTIADLVSVPHPDYAAVVGASLPFIDFLFLSETEAEFLVGRPITDESGALEVSRSAMAAAEIFERGVQRLVTIHAPEGAVVFDGKGNRYGQGSVNLPKRLCRSAVGAGDAFAAGFMYGLHEDWEVDACLRTAVCVAASCLLDDTCSEGILSLEECLDLGKLYGYRAFAEGEPADQP